MNLPKHLLPTTVVGSYPQPEWLVDREMLSKLVPRTRLMRMWRIPQAHLNKPKTTRRSLRSETSNAPASTSSPTAKSGARATPTVLRPRLRGSTTKTLP